MTQGDLFSSSTYREGYDPGLPSCADCIRVDPGWISWKAPSHCLLHGLQVDRVLGRCDDLEKRENEQ